uniref:procollagen-proline 4-dioxygenase n=1 Tax=Araucaria cunninghamii TaxID=56994 RepID=A0A0D6QZA4_ARACU
MNAPLKSTRRMNAAAMAMATLWKRNEICAVFVCVCALIIVGKATRELNDNDIIITDLPRHRQQQQEPNVPITYPTKVQQISWKPRAFVYRGFLSDEECDHLISLAKTELKRSAVADNGSGKGTVSEVRTSSGMFIPKGKDEIVTRIEEKIAAWTFLPKENGEDIQVLRYEPGQKYDPHFDFFHDKVNLARGGHRVATVLMYLTDVAKGGETVFPSAEVDSRRRVNIQDDTLSDCAKKGVAVKPKRGDALLFFSLTPGAITDSSSLHAGCPVIEGEKWSATKWIHVDSFDKIPESSGNCVDENDRCGEWAAYGECINNPEYMVGSTEVPGACRKSCKVC